MTGGGTGRKRKKLNVLDIILDRKSQEINFTLTKEELAKLLFRKMAIQESQVVKIDTSAFGKIHVELKENVKPEKFVNLPIFDIREGLRTKFYRPHHRQDTLVKISWLDLETSDDLLLHILSFFGKAKSGVQYCTMREEEGESNLAKLLNKIPNGERQVWMEMKTSLPSYAVIDGRRVKIWYPGMKRTCARCNMAGETCPGGANARLCEENGGQKTKTEDMWKNLLETVNYVVWDGEEVESIADETGDTEEVSNVELCDGIVITNVNEKATDEEIKGLLLEGLLDGKEIEKVKIETAGNPKSRLVTGFSKANITPLTKKLNKKIVDGVMIHCKPHAPSTPPTKATPNPVTEDATNSIVVNVTEPSPKEGTSKQTIPGMPEADRLKEIKKQKRKETKQKKKETKEKKETKQKKATKVKNDFLKKRKKSLASAVDEDSDGFVFTEYETDEDSDAFEDAHTDNDESINNFLTPIQYKSVFGLRLSTSTPDLAMKLLPKRPAPSPVERPENKKSKSSSGSIQ